MKRGISISLILITIFSAFPVLFANGQISAPGADFTEKTVYPAFQETDSIYIFCTNEGVNIGELVVSTNLTGEKSFTWEKFNNLANRFEPFSSEVTSNDESSVSNLTDGCYRATVTKNDTAEVYRAWVMNNWFTAKAEVTESDCEFFKLGGSFNTANLVYYDLSDTTKLELFKDINVEWKLENELVAKVSNPQIYDPPTQDTDYKFTVADRFGCSASSTVTYISIVTKANFEIDGKFSTGEQQGEAPLIVTFTNTSENGTPGEYEWFFFRDMGQIKKEAGTSAEPIDSILFMAYDDNLIYTYENTGSYMVKLVSKKISEFHTCTDTLYLEDFIVADSSYFDVPNFFSPDGNGTNDQFVVKFWSMQDVKITIVNRWGKTAHVWEETNVRGFEGTWLESVWDGKIGGRFASPGVYYYVIEGLGRDGMKRWKHGFFHLFRAKD